jgi:hypothetical protein
MVSGTAWAQSEGALSNTPQPTTSNPQPRTYNPTTRAVVLANRPAHFSPEEWLQMMDNPVNRSLYPLRVTQAMLDTLDTTKLDLRFQYVLVRKRHRMMERE